MIECSKHVENIIIRKVSIFYIETVLNFFFQLRKIIFLRSIEKKMLKMLKKFRKSEKCQGFVQNPLGFWNILKFFLCKSKKIRKFSLFFTYFFSIDLRKNIFWSWKKSWVQFRCKNLRPFDLWGFQSDWITHNDAKA